MLTSLFYFSSPLPSPQLDLPSNVCRRLEYEFHSSSYHTLNEVVVGLRTLLGYLAKVRSPRSGCVWEGMKGLLLVQALSEEEECEHKQTTLLQFVRSQYDQPADESSIFAVIGIKKSGRVLVCLSACLSSLLPPNAVCQIASKLS